MAINGTAVWRIRTGGSSLNGAGYDSAIGGAGTDYSQQDAAQLSVTDGATSGAGSTTLTSVTGGFTTAMIGNAVRIASGTNFQAGYYFITARTDTNTVTLDRTPSSGGAGSGGNVKVGGAQRQPGDSLYNSVVAGNIVYLRASAGNAASFPTSSLDYTVGSFFTPTSGSAASGLIKWIGENGIPTIDCPGLAFYQASFNWLEGLYFVATTNSNGTNGIINGSDCEFLSNIVNMNDKTSLVGVFLSNGNVRGNIIYGGTASPSASSGCHGLRMGDYTGTIQGNRIYNCRDVGIYVEKGGAIRENLVYGCAGDGIFLAGAAVAPGAVVGNTVNNNGGHGVRVDAANGAAWHTIRNNILSNHATAGKYGISVATSSSDKRKRDWGYNCVYNNNGTYENVTAASTDITTNPAFVDAANGDFTPTAAGLKVAFPTAFGSVSNEVWIGAVQPVAAGGGSGGGLKLVGSGGLAG